MSIVAEVIQITGGVGKEEKSAQLSRWMPGWSNGRMERMPARKNL